MAQMTFNDNCEAYVLFMRRDMSFVTYDEMMTSKDIWSINLSCTEDSLQSMYPFYMAANPSIGIAEANELILKNIETAMDALDSNEVYGSFSQDQFTYEATAPIDFEGYTYLTFTIYPNA